MNNMVIVCFDVSCDRRLRRVSRELGNFGARVQRSVFECHLEEGQLDELKRRLARLIDEDGDHVRYYPLCQKDVDAVVVDGPGAVTADSDFLLV